MSDQLSIKMSKQLIVASSVLLKNIIYVTLPFHQMSNNYSFHLFFCRTVKHMKHFQVQCSDFNKPQVGLHPPSQCATRARGPLKSGRLLQSRAERQESLLFPC